LSAASLWHFELINHLEEKMKVILFSVLAILGATPAFSDHSIEELQGKWESTLFPVGAGYIFHGVLQHGDYEYLFHQERGSCTGSGVINLVSGFVRSVEICPPRNGETDERVYLNIWKMTTTDGQLHLLGGYYSEGSSTRNVENLYKLDDDHGDDDEDHHEDDDHDE
jgi:hypothetical protein